MPNYDDMMGLDMYDGLDQFYTPSMIRDTLIAAGAGAGSILLASWLGPMIPVPKDWEEDPEKAINVHRLRAAIVTLGGALVGRGLWDYNRDAAMAVIGGVAGLGLAQVVDSFFKDKEGNVSQLVGTPFGVLPEDLELDGADEAMMQYGDATTALSDLERTNIDVTPGAFQEPVITPEALMGTVVQQETLGAYNPYMA
jgi:hypothetical protein